MRYLYATVITSSRIGPQLMIGNCTKVVLYTVMIIVDRTYFKVLKIELRFE